MYDYYIEQLKTDFNESRTAWKTIKTQLENVYMLDHTSRACKKSMTRASNNIEAWFKRVESLMNRLPKDDRPPSIELIAELGKELKLRYLSAFSGLSCTVSTLTIDKDREEAIMIVVRSIGKHVANMEETRQSLVGYMEETRQSLVD